MNRFILVIATVLACTLPGNAQFTLLNDAVQLDDNTWRLTQASQSQKGQMWHEDPIDLSQDFEIHFRINLGTSLTGGDGVTFTLQTSCLSAGGHASAMGVVGIEPSVLLEFDSYFNSSKNDPDASHIALFKNGDNFHGSENQLSNDVGSNNVSVNNMENGVWRDVIVTWTAATQTFAMNYSGFDLLAHSSDLINTVFDGNTAVYWGFTGSTGGSVNVQRVQVIEYPDNPLTLADQTICPGGSVQNGFLLNGTYSWQGEGVSDPSVPRPWFSPEEDTEYLLSFEDSCGNLSSYKFNVSIADTVQTSVINGNTEVFCDASNESYSVSGFAGSTYEWSVPEGAEILSGVGTDSIIVDFNESFGTISVVEISSEGCIGEPQSTLVTCLITSLPIYESNWVPVFPNPTSSVIRLSGQFINAPFQITDLSGRIVYRGVLRNSDIDVARLSSGTYFGTVDREGQVHRFKFIKR